MVDRPLVVHVTQYTRDAYESLVTQLDSQGADEDLKRTHVMRGLDLTGQEWEQARDHGIRFIVVHANSGVNIYANQAIREGFVLATFQDQCLIEYEMPSGTTALRICDARALDGRQPGTPYKTQSYKTVPDFWLRAMIEAGTTWTARPQGGYHKRKVWGAPPEPAIPSPGEMLASRLYARSKESTKRERRKLP